LKNPAAPISGDKADKFPLPTSVFASGFDPTRRPDKTPGQDAPTPMNRDPPKVDKSPLRSDKLDEGNALAVQFKLQVRNE